MATTSTVGNNTFQKRLSKVDEDKQLEAASNIESGQQMGLRGPKSGKPWKEAGGILGIWPGVKREVFHDRRIGCTWGQQQSKKGLEPCSFKSRPR